MRRVLLIATLLPLAGCGAALTVGGVVIAQSDDDSDDVDAVPAVSVDTPTGSVNDLIPITYRLTDPDVGDRASVRIEYSSGGSAYQTATSAFGGGAEGTSNLSTSLTGDPHTFLWNTTEDLGFVNASNVTVRVTPVSDQGISGQSIETGSFNVNNRFITTLSRRPVAAGIQPVSIALSTQGDVIMADGPGHRVVQLAKSTGVVTILAGTGEPGSGGDKILGTTAQLNFPTSVATDSTGDVVLVDAFNLTIRKIDVASGFISNAAGPGFSTSEDELGTNALFFTRDLALDGNGNPFFTDADRIRALNLNGASNLSFPLGTVNVAGCLPDPVTIAPSRVASVVARDSDCGGTSSFARPDLKVVEAVVLDTTGGARTLYYLERGPPGAGGSTFPRVVAANLGTTSVTLETLTAGAVTLLPGNAVNVIGPSNGLGTFGSFPDMALFAGSVLLVSSETEAVIRAFNLSSASVSVAGTQVASGGRAIVVGSGEVGFEGDGLGPLQVQLVSPISVGADTSGNIYVGEGIGRVRLVAAPNQAFQIGSQSIPGGTVASLPNVLAGTVPEINAPLFMTIGPSGDLFVTDSNANDPRSNRLFRLSANDATTSVAFGDGVFGNSGDGGLATAARAGTLTYPAVSPDGGIVCVPDGTHHRVRAINLGSGSRTFLGVTIAAGAVETVVGTGIATVGSSVSDGGSPRQASLRRPLAAAFDAQGLLYVSDTGNNRIRVCNPLQGSVTVGGVTVAPGTIMTVAGTGDLGSPGSDGDGGAATAARLARPAGLLGPDGNLFVLDGLDEETNPNPAPRLKVVNLGSQAVTYGTVTVGPGSVATIVGSGAARANDNANLGDGGPPLAATFRGLSGVSSRGDAILFLADADDHRIRVVNFSAQSRTFGTVSVAPNTIQTVVGNGIPAFDGDPSPVTGSVNNPLALVALSDGRVLFVDRENGSVRMANLGEGGPRSFGGITAQRGEMVVVGGSRSGKVTVGTPRDLVVDAGKGIVIFSDTGNLNDAPGVLQLDLKTRVVRRLAGTLESPGSNTPLGDGGPALLASLNQPRGLHLTSSGLWIAEAGGKRIRFVNRSASAVTPAAGTTVQPGNIATVLDGSNGDDDTTNDDGVALVNSSLDLSFPESVSQAGTLLWVADPSSNRVLRADLSQGRIDGVLLDVQIGAASATGKMTDPAPAASARALTDTNGSFNSPQVFSGDTLVITAVTGSNLTINGSLVTQFPVSVPITKVDSNTALTLGAFFVMNNYVAGTLTYRIERRLETRAVAALSDTVAYIGGRGVGVGGSRIFRITRVGTTWTFEHIAGTGSSGWNGDQLASTAMNFEEIVGLELDGSLLYVTDSGLNRLVAVNLSGGPVTVASLQVDTNSSRTIAGAGQGTPGFNGDAVPPVLSLLSQPSGVAVDASGVYLADQGNARLRRFQK